MKQDLALGALNRAIAIRRPPPGCIHHRDRGSQYCAHDHQKLLRKHALTPSMSGKGNCYDNSAVESFFKSLKAELVWRPNWQTRRKVEVAIFEYINGFDNPRRKHSALGWKSPVAFEQVFAHEIRPTDIVLFREALHWVKYFELSLPADGSVPFLSFDDDCFYRQWALDIGQDDGAMMETVFECSSAAGIMAAVNAGLGVALLSDRYLRPDMEVVRDRLPVLLCLPMSSAGRANQEIRRWIA